MRRSQITFVILGVMLAFAVVLHTLGYGRLLQSSGDHAADFIKALLTLPGPSPLVGPFDTLVRAYAKTHPTPGNVLLFHMPPFSMVLSLAARDAFGVISPGALFLILAGVVLVALTFTILHLTGNIYWALAAVVSYPAVTVIDRGNLYAGLCGVCLIAALIRQKPDLTAAVLCAVALNLRPNAAICVLPLLGLNWRWGFRLGLAGAVLLIASFVLANELYPPYNLWSFVTGLDHYSNNMVRDGGGVDFGSSLYGGLFTLGFKRQYALSTTIGLFPLVPAVCLWFKQRLGYDDAVFVAIAVMALATPVFADYHLLVFLAPLILAKSRTVAVFSLLLVMPKGWWELHESTIQAVLNPAIMLVGVIAVLARCWLSARQRDLEAGFARPHGTVEPNLAKHDHRSGGPATADC